MSAKKLCNLIKRNGVKGKQGNRKVRNMSNDFYWRIRMQMVCL